VPAVSLKFNPDQPPFSPLTVTAPKVVVDPPDAVNVVPDIAMLVALTEPPDWFVAVVAVVELPVQEPDDPVTLPVTLPVKLPANAVAVSNPVLGLNDSFVLEVLTEENEPEFDVDSAG
jgi:hypothetical protein